MPIWTNKFWQFVTATLFLHVVNFPVFYLSVTKDKLPLQVTASSMQIIKRMYYENGYSFVAWMRALHPFYASDGHSTQSTFWTFGGQFRVDRLSQHPYVNESGWCGLWAGDIVCSYFFENDDDIAIFGPNWIIQMWATCGSNRTALHATQLTPQWAFFMSDLRTWLSHAYATWTGH